MAKQKTIKKIAIVGTAASASLANNLDDSWVIYGCNGAYQILNRFDLHFEMHEISYLRGLKIEEEYFEFLKQCRDRTILNNKYNEFPDAQIFPIKEVLEHFKTRYFNNTIAYMIAFAIINNPELTDIALFGVDMAGDSEYAHQRPCCEFFLGWARAKGIKVTTPKSSPLIKTTHLYGIESPPSFLQSMREKKEILKSKLQEAEENKRTSDYNHAYIKGMSDLVENLLKVHN